jgi:methionine synthase II (cobalamin-independent)
MTLNNGTSKSTVEEITTATEPKKTKKKVLKKKLPTPPYLVTVSFRDIHRTPFMMQTVWEEVIKANIQRHTKMSWPDRVQETMIGFGEFEFLGLDGYRWFACFQADSWLFCQMWFMSGKKAKENPAAGDYSILRSAMPLRDAIKTLTSPFDISEDDQRKIVERIQEKRDYNLPPANIVGNI